MKKFERKLGGKLVTLIITDCDSTPQLDKVDGKETADFTGLNFDGVLSKIGFDYTYDLPTSLKMLERRILYCKMLKGNKPLEKLEADRLAELTTELSDYSGSHSDGLFYEFVNVLRELELIEMYSPTLFLSQEQKDIRKKQAIEILTKLRAKREASLIA